MEVFRRPNAYSIIQFVLKGTRLMSDIFVSYSSKDKQVAFEICEALENKGISCWIAPRDVPLGMEYAEAIVEAIRNARAFVLIFSSQMGINV